MKSGLVLLALLISLYANELFASNSKAKVQAPTKSTSLSKLTTDAQFGDQVVSGQYQMPFESVSTVENEKNIDALIGVRKNFHDRIQKSKSYRNTK